MPIVIPVGSFVIYALFKSINSINTIILICPLTSTYLDLDVNESALFVVFIGFPRKSQGVGIPTVSMDDTAGAGAHSRSGKMDSQRHRHLLSRKSTPMSSAGAAATAPLIVVSFLDGKCECKCEPTGTCECAHKSN